MDPREAGRLLVKKLTTRPPFGARITAKVNGTTPWWTTDPEGPAFEAARRALRMGFGKDTAMIGAGGTIGFVQPFADLLRGAPCILMGVADPNTHAHSENESLHLGDWVKAMRSTIHLSSRCRRGRSTSTPTCRRATPPSSSRSRTARCSRRSACTGRRAARTTTATRR
jgi:acetylornithine deacetylase/succinyl-diaminopimelate desuccinylase-like protein